MELFHITYVAPPPCHMSFLLPVLIGSLHSSPSSRALSLDLPLLCIINNFKGTKAAKLGPPLSSVMTNELSLRSCISLALLWPHPGERATAVPSGKPKQMIRQQNGNRNNRLLSAFV